MNFSKIFKRTLVGAGFLAAISASSALGVHPVPAVAAWSIDWVTPALAQRDNDPLTLVLLTLAFMGIIVKRRHKA